MNLLFKFYKICIIVIIFIAIGNISCATRTKYMTAMQIPQVIDFEKLDKTQYYIMGDTIGSACVEYVGLWPIPVWWEDSNNHIAVLSSIDNLDTARRSAYYDALEKIPQADALLAPRIEQTDDSAGIWYGKRCVTIRAKAIRIIANDPNINTPHSDKDNEPEEEEIPR